MIKFISLLGLFGLVLSGCSTIQPVNHPCGVIVDSLRDVHGTTPSGDNRISRHFERGVAAGCWSRAGSLTGSALQ
jgi:hypothetical protein